jgi:hypothetical protein
VAADGGLIVGESGATAKGSDGAAAEIHSGEHHSPCLVAIPAGAIRPSALSPDRVSTAQLPRYVCSEKRPPVVTARDPNHFASRGEELASFAYPGFAPGGVVGER